MLAQLGAILAAVCSAVETIFGIRFRILARMAVIAVPLGGCIPTSVPLASADHADSGPKVPGGRHHSTIAPYTTRRPTAPSSWREQNDRVALVPTLAH